MTLRGPFELAAHLHLICIALSARRQRPPAGKVGNFWEDFLGGILGDFGNVCKSPGGFLFFWG